MSSAIERTFHGQELTIEKATPLCAHACSRHLGDRQACVDARRFRLYSECARDRFWRGDFPGSRQMLRRAMTIAPVDRKARAYYVASFISPHWVRPLRRLRAALRARKSPPRHVPGGKRGTITMHGG
jgi:hypothetical protein